MTPDERRDGHPLDSSVFFKEKAAVFMRYGTGDVGGERPAQSVLTTDSRLVLAAVQNRDTP